ncbi:NADPH:quinone reductase [Actinophytocola xinjiangensis]|uniref:NADPH:quinone reductase n=1 Tax=Actinophytocola xinjiangensis TaxID=485602 RepID=A0A7Z0WMT2_9PSEU|nr:NADP-dependent oxidoreductase [Actinophytocola xinjiangensis]OLF08710.1 NADPH:quinone reductase [Actinophytocola xinjiangensis]
MRAARIHAYGPPDVIRLDDVDRPEPGPGQVLVEVAATSFNPTETALRAGVLRDLLGQDPPLPLTLGWDVAGTVVARGPGVHTPDVGDRVIGMIDAAAAEFTVAAADALVPAPASLALADAAALPLAGMTAWQLVERAALTPGERVLVNGAGGGIGGYAVQLARRAGAHVIATASARSRAAVLANGADEILDHTTTALAAAGPVDVVLHLVPAAEQRIAELVALARRIVSATNPIPGAPAAHVVTRNDPKHLAALADLVDRRELTVDVSERHTIADLPAIHRRGEAGDLRGKVVLRP